jgi:hypothetical protein
MPETASTHDRGGGSWLEAAPRAQPRRVASAARSSRFSMVAIGVVESRISKRARSRRRARYGSEQRLTGTRAGPLTQTSHDSDRQALPCCGGGDGPGSSPSPYSFWRATYWEANDETRPTSVRAVPGRPPRSYGIRAAGVVGSDQLDVSSRASLPSARSRFEVRDPEDSRHGTSRDGCCRRRHNPCGPRPYVVCSVRLIGTWPTSAVQERVASRTLNQS